MKRIALFAILSILLFPAALAAKDAQPQFKNIVVKPFTVADGVNLTANGVTLSPGLVNEFNTRLSAKLQQMNLAVQIVPDASGVAASDTAGSLVIEGAFTEFKANILDRRTLTAEVGIYRLSDHSLMQKIKSDYLDQGVKSDTVQRRIMADFARQIADLIKKALR